MLGFIDPPGPYAPLMQWRAFLKQLVAMPQSQQVRFEVKHAREMIARKLREERQAGQQQQT
jgi:hypothetical protein